MADLTPLDLLRKYRPVRYEHGDETWMQAAIDAQRDRIEKGATNDPNALARLARDAAEVIIRRMEQDDTRKAHQFLRNVGRSGQPPLSLEVTGYSACPLKIDRKEKLRLEVASIEDLVRWELSRRREHDNDTQRMLWEARGAGRLAEWMKGQGATSLGGIDWRAIPLLASGATIEPDLPDDDDDAT